MKKINKNEMVQIKNYEEWVSVYCQNLSKFFDTVNRILPEVIQIICDEDLH